MIIQSASHENDLKLVAIKRYIKQKVKTRKMGTEELDKLLKLNKGKQ